MVENQIPVMDVPLQGAPQIECSKMKEDCSNKTVDREVRSWLEWNKSHLFDMYFHTENVKEAERNFTLTDDLLCGSWCSSCFNNLHFIYQRR